MVGCVGYLLLKMYAQLKHPTSVDCWACQTIVVTVISIISSVLLRWKHSYPSIKFTENSANSVIIHAFNMLMCSFMAIFQPYSSFIMEFAFIIFYILNPTFFDADFRHAHTHIQPHQSFISGTLSSSSETFSKNANYAGNSSSFTVVVVHMQKRFQTCCCFGLCIWLKYLILAA